MAIIMNIEMYIRNRICGLLFVVIASYGVFAAPAYAEQLFRPYGISSFSELAYAPTKVVYDVFSGSESKLANIIDRVSMLQNLYGVNPFDASIVVVIHGDAIPIFATRNLDKYENLMRRVHSLTLSEVIEFRLCGASAKVRGYNAQDFHGFVSVVPMADAEIVRLQHDGYAYMQ